MSKKYPRRQTPSHEQLRLFDAACKHNAIEHAYAILGIYIKFDEICATHLNHNEEDWFSDRMMDIICDPESSFTSEDCDKMARAMQELSKEMQECADEILSAQYLKLDDMPDDELRDLSHKVYGDDMLLEARQHDRETK